MGLFNTKKSSSIMRSGDDFMNDFVAAINNIVTAETAKHMAERSEGEVMQLLQQLGLSNGVYLTPQDIPDETKELLVKESLDAHIKRAQSEQVSTAAIQQATLINQKLNQHYKGCKVGVIIQNQSAKPIESVWFNNKTNQYTLGTVRKNITGIVEEILVEKNLLILKPTLMSRTLNPGHKNYLIHVIDPYTMQPSVKLSIIN